MEIDRLKRRILYNCDVTDAQHSGFYSVCGLVMRLRDLYKWEHRLPPWQEDASSDVLGWIGEKETLWEGMMDVEYRPLPINGHTVDAFDTGAVNQQIAPLGLRYGAGYAHSLKPTFFLAAVDDCTVVEGRKVWVLGREHARDLLTLPAFSQNDQVVLRTEAGRMHLWDQILYMSKSGRRGFDYAMAACGFEDHHVETIRRRFDDLWTVQKTIYLRHELGEIAENVFDRKIWKGILTDFPHTAVELYARTLKDILADTGEKGTLAHLVFRRNKAALGLYMAFGNGITRMLTKPLTCAFDAFTADSDWELIEKAANDVRVEVKDHTRRLIEIYLEGRRRSDLKSTRCTIEDIMRNKGLVR